MKIRIKFTKMGPIRYVGHLDFMRTFQKLLKRAGYAMVYSPGFNPHIILSFAAPLGVGEESCGEYADADFAWRDPGELTPQEAYRLKDLGLDQDELPEPPGVGAFLERFNEAAPDGVRAVFAGRIPPIKGSKAMALVRDASFLLALPDDLLPELDAPALSEALASFAAREEIVISKKTKTAVKDTDIRPLISRIELADEALPAGFLADGFDRGRVISLRCAQGSSRNLKPASVLEAFSAHLGMPFDAADVRVIRTELYDGEGRPLSETAEIF